jgi:hypothetical protein
VEPAPQKPINWEELVSAPDDTPAQPAQPQQAQEPQAPVPPQTPEPPAAEALPEVDEETRAILDRAAKELQNKLRGNDDDGEKQGS